MQSRLQCNITSPDEVRIHSPSAWSVHGLWLQSISSPTIAGSGSTQVSLIRGGVLLPGTDRWQYCKLCVSFFLCLASLIFHHLVIRENRQKLINQTNDSYLAGFFLLLCLRRFFLFFFYINDFQRWCHRNEVTDKVSLQETGIWMCHGFLEKSFFRLSL